MPPTPHYVLLSTNQGALGDAMRKVAYERTVGDADYRIEDFPIAAVDGQRSLRAWLSSLGGRDTARACGLEFNRTVVWVGRWSLRQVVQAMQAEARRNFAAMARELQRRKLVQPEETEQLSPLLDLRLSDHRGAPQQPLPDGEWLLGNAR